MRFVPLVGCALFMLAHAGAQADPANRGMSSSREEASLVEEVLVTGEHPGPGLWKVSNGGNTLWILGTHAPLPEQLAWRSQEVELVMTEAQQVLGNYSASFTLQGANPLATKGRPLRKLLSRKEYAQWLALKKKYIGNYPEIENALPVTAALVLRSNAFGQAGLGGADQVWRGIYKMAKEYNVPVTTAHQVNKVFNRAVQNDAKAQRKGVAFLVDTMTNLETDLRAARVEANAWAVGDIDALKKQAQADRNSANLYASSWPFLTDEELKSLTAETDARWIEAAAQALNKNRTTFAALPIYLLLQSDGLLSALRAKGFVVEEPVY